MTLSIVLISFTLSRESVIHRVRTSSHLAAIIKIEFRFSVYKTLLMNDDDDNEEQHLIAQ